MKSFRLAVGSSLFNALYHNHPHGKARWIRRKAPRVTTTTRAEAQDGLATVRFAVADSGASQEFQRQDEWVDLRELLRRKQFRN